MDERELEITIGGTGAMTMREWYCTIEGQHAWWLALAVMADILAGAIVGAPADPEAFG